MSGPSTEELTPSGRHRRADALRNRDRVVEAAAAVLAERGLDAGVPEIAERAGVGKGTVYRSFPTRQHLVAAVLVERIGGLERLAEAAVEHPDARAALRELVLGMVDRMTADRCLADAFQVVAGTEEVRAAKARVRRHVDHLLARAQRDGTVRGDVTADDVAVLLAGLGRTGSRRHAELLLDALDPR